MKAEKITIEIGYENKLEFVTYKNIEVMKAMQKLNKEYKNCIIYKLVTIY